MSALGELDAAEVGGQGGHRHGEVRRVKCEVLAINVSLCEQCGCGTLVLWGKMFPCSAFVGPFRLSCLGNGISHRTPWWLIESRCNSPEEREG